MIRKIRRKASFRQAVTEDTQPAGSPAVIEAPTYRDSRTACAIAQQYSSATFVSLCPPSHKKKDAIFKNIILNLFIIFLNLLSVKLHQPAVYVEECPYTTATNNNQFNDGTKKL